jgi:hypothetical protein
MSYISSLRTFASLRDIRDEIAQRRNERKVRNRGNPTSQFKKVRQSIIPIT